MGKEVGVLRGRPMLDRSPDGVEVRAQLARVTAHSGLRGAPRLSRFLTFVVEATLTGCAETIKAYTIAVEALGRGDDFDPQNDPIVRVEAGRLRAALARYYAGPGRDDPLVIEVPRGTYVPVFRRAGTTKPDAPAPAEIVKLQPEGDGLALMQQYQRTAAMRDNVHRQVQSLLAEISATRATIKDSRSLLGLALPPPDVDSLADEPQPVELAARPIDLLPAPAARCSLRACIAAVAGHVRAHARIYRRAIYVVGLLAVLEVVFDIDRPLHGGANTGLFFKLFSAPQNTADQAARGVAAPIIYVEPPVLLGQPSPPAVPAKLIRDRMIDALARFDDVTIIDSDMKAAPASPASASGALPPSYYRLATTIRYGAGDALATTVRLIDTADATAAWSKTYDRTGGADAAAEPSVVAADVARSLLQPFAAVEARERLKRAAADNRQDTYRCILDANANLRNFDPSQYPSVENCLIHATAMQPPAVSVFVALAHIYMRNYRFGIAGAPGDRATLDRAYQMAERAVAIKPDSALAQFALQDVLLGRGDLARAKAAGDASYRLNPNDGAVVFGHAMLLIMLGDADAGTALLRQNAAKTAAPWVGYHLLLGLAWYLKGDFENAAVDTAQIAAPYLPPGLVLDAIVASKNGDRLRAHQDIAMLYRRNPAWRENFRGNVALFLPDPAMADRLAADFNEAAADLIE